MRLQAGPNESIAHHVGRMDERDASHLALGCAACCRQQLHEGHVSSLHLGAVHVQIPLRLRAASISR